jgi:hypothetical protein
MKLERFLQTLEKQLQEGFSGMHKYTDRWRLELKGWKPKIHLVLAIRPTQDEEGNDSIEVVEMATGGSSDGETISRLSLDLELRPIDLGRAD